MQPIDTPLVFGGGLVGRRWSGLGTGSGLWGWTPVAGLGGADPKARSRSRWCRGVR